MLRGGFDDRSSLALDRGLWLSRFRFAGVKLQQRLPNRLGHEPAHLGFPMKLHLTLGWVDVHVHGGGVHFQEQAADGVAPLHQGGVIPF